MGQALTPALPLDLPVIDIMALSPEMSQEWAKNPLPPPETESPKTRLIKEMDGGVVSTTTVMEYVAYEAENKAIEPSLALAIVRAESNFVWDAKNTIGTASGVWQFLDSTFLHFCSNDLSEKNDPIIQTDCALTLIHNGGLNHWLASRKQWAYALVKHDSP